MAYNIVNFYDIKPGDWGWVSPEGTIYAGIGGYATHMQLAREILNEPADMPEWEAIHVHDVNSTAYGRLMNSGWVRLVATPSGMLIFDSSPPKAEVDKPAVVKTIRRFLDENSYPWKSLHAQIGRTYWTGEAEAFRRHGINAPMAASFEDKLTHALL